MFQNLCGTSARRRDAYLEKKKLDQHLGKWRQPPSSSCLKKYKDRFNLFLYISLPEIKIHPKAFSAFLEDRLSKMPIGDCFRKIFEYISTFPPLSYKLIKTVWNNHEKMAQRRSNVFVSNIT